MPFNIHREPLLRYRKWRETSSVYLDDALVETRTREFTMDVLRRLNLHCDAVQSPLVIEMPQCPDGPENTGAFPPPEPPPGWLHSYWVTWHYHKQCVQHVTLSGWVWPGCSMAISYALKTYGGQSDRFVEDWISDPPYSVATTNVNTTLPLKDIRMEPEAVEFEFAKDIEWYQEFDFLCFAYGAIYQYLRWLLSGNVGAANGAGSSAPPVPEYLTWGGQNITHKKVLKVIQRVELLDPATDWFDEANALLGQVSFPAIGRREAMLNSRGQLTFKDYTGDAGFGYNYFPFWSNDVGLGIATHDPRLFVDVARLAKTAWWLTLAHSVTEQYAGREPQVSWYPFNCTPTSHVHGPIQDVRVLQVNLAG